jgi:hypothetical protein
MFTYLTSLLALKITHASVMTDTNTLNSKDPECLTFINHTPSTIAQKSFLEQHSVLPS